jgi:uncharacterized membrane protein (DUF4010 family)
VALGVGLLIGAERERRKRTQRAPASAGIRTFAVASLAGAVSFALGGVWGLAVTTVVVGLFTALAYWRVGEKDPGLTSEVALVLTVLLGGLAVKRTDAAAACGVVAAILLAARTRLHHFVASVVTEREVRDGLILAAATLVVLPLLPDRPMGPFDALNPRSIWLILVLVLAIGAAGHVSVRAFGARFGLPVAGLAGGFISSVATIGAMGARSKASSAVMPAATAGAVLSTVATVVQMAAVLAVASMQALYALSMPLLCAGVAAGAYGLAFTLRALRASSGKEVDQGQAFSLSTALTFALTLSAIMVLSAAFREWFGVVGSMVAAGLAGFVDTHSAAVSTASLVGPGRISAAEAVVPILVAFSTNTVSKIVMAWMAGGPAFALRVIPGLILVAAAAWAGLLVSEAVG